MTIIDVPDLPQFYETLSALSTQLSGIHAAVDKVLGTDSADNAESADNVQNTHTADSGKGVSHDMSHGVSLLQLKNHTLIQYLLSLSVLMLRKVEGKDSIDDSAWAPILTRTTIERIRPLEQKIQYQIDKLLRTSTNTELSYKPDLDEFASSEEEEEEEEETKYKAPRLAAAFYHDKVSKEVKKKAEDSVKLGRGLLKDLQSEMSSAPHFVSHANPLRQDKRSREKQEYEEEHFVRMASSKEDKKKARRSSGFDILNFDDNDMIRTAEKERGQGGGLKKFGKKKGKKGKKKFKSKK